MNHLKLLSVLFSAKALLAKIAAQQDPSDALERLKRAVSACDYLKEEEVKMDVCGLT